MLSSIPRTQSAGACQLWYCKYHAYILFEWGKIQAMQSLSYQLICIIHMSIQFTLHCILGMKMGDYSLAEPPCTYPGIGIKSGISVCELISTQKKKKKKKKAHAGNEWSTILQNSSQAKATTIDDYTPDKST